jgi:dipeptidyl aminopeptidase/acylaminoacyl peptidase
VAFVGALRANDFYGTTHVMVAPVEGGTACDLTAALDNWVSPDDVVGGGSEQARIAWSADDTTLVVPFDRRGANWVATIKSEGGEAKELLGGARVHGLVRLSNATKRLYYTLSTPTTLSELWTANADGTGARKLLGVNDTALRAMKLVSPEKVQAKNTAGDTIDAWLYPPVDFDPAKTYPMILYIHGGPQEYDGEFFETGLENQLFPGKGWAVLRVNYRGSTSYGEEFSHALWGDWHTREFEDLMAAVDVALLSHPWIDPHRLGVGGWSYGGIMTVWIVGHTDRFKVGVPERFEVDYLSCFGTDQWHTQYIAEFGKPWENAERYREKSPGAFITNIKTPLFLIANEKDGNCPPTQAMQFYQRLKLMNQPTELVIYPDESHSMTVPSHYVDRLHRLIDWFGRYLK